MQRVATVFAWCLAALIVAPVGALADDRRVVAETRATALNDVDVLAFPVGSFAQDGGALEEIGDHLVVATPTGQLILVLNGARREAGNVELSVLPENVPTNLRAIGGTRFAQYPGFWSHAIRVADIHYVPGDQNTGPALLFSHHVIEGPCIAFAVSMVSVSLAPDGVPRLEEDWRRIFTARPCLEPMQTEKVFAGHQSGGKIIQHEDSVIWIAIGDHEMDGVNHPVAAPMRDDADLGKVIAINLKTGAHEIVARGLRNPQGLVVAGDGTLWSAEHGPRGGDEVNLIVPGRNYGWPNVTLGLGYKGPWRTNPSQGRHDDYTKPAFAFLPSIAPSALAEADAREFPRWEDDLILGSLKDKAIHRLRRDGDAIIYSERMIELPHRVRDVITLSDGRLAALSDDAHVILIERSADAPRQIWLGGLNATRRALQEKRADLGLVERYREERFFAVTCGNCHLDTDLSIAPPLAELMGREVGSYPGYRYSQALLDQREIWDEALLFRYLSDPQGTFEGTAKRDLNLSLSQAQKLTKWLARRD